MLGTTAVRFTPRPTLLVRAALNCSLVVTAERRPYWNASLRNELLLCGLNIDRIDRADPAGLRSL